MERPDGNKLLATLIALYAEQESLTIKYEIERETA